MTAEELKAIYEPAFEAAGGGLSDDVRYTHDFGDDPANKRFVMRMADGHGWYRAPMSIAANACRCWAEDWLHRKGMHLQPHGWNPGIDDLGWQLFGAIREAWTHSGSSLGPTIHHALAAAVIAVAKAKEKA